MPTTFEGKVIFPWLVTQSAIGKPTPFDTIEDVITKSIDYVKANNINARIANVVLNIDGKLVLAQIYIQRKNGFAPAKESQFGTSPTEYNVQVRFPYGLEAKLGEQQITIPRGNFSNTLTPYMGRVYMLDDVQRDTDPGQVILGAGVERVQDSNDPSRFEVFCANHPEERISFRTKNQIGGGYYLSYGTYEYYDAEDFKLKNKMNGVYPLFYSDAKQSTLLLSHPEYQGYSQATREGAYTHYEKREGSKERKEQYAQYIQCMRSEIADSAPGKRWQNTVNSPSQEEEYVLDLTVINGMTLHTQSGLPLRRLRNYQLDLFNNCLEYAEQVEQQREGPAHPNQTGTIDMGVGAGKTYFTFTLLQHLSQEMKERKRAFHPLACLAPDQGVAHVTEQSINKQGLTTGISAASISSPEQMPDENFLALYQRLSKFAERDSQRVNQFIKHEFQNHILAFCRERGMHPYQMSGYLYEAKMHSHLSGFKDSIDIKRVLLMIEGQLSILGKTGGLSVTALKSLKDEFSALEKGIQEGKIRQKNFDEHDAKRSAYLQTIRDLPVQEKISLRRQWDKDNPKPKEGNQLFVDMLNATPAPAVIPEAIDRINYDQPLQLHRSCTNRYPNGYINICNITASDVKSIMGCLQKTSTKFDIRNRLVAIVGLDDKEAAITIANSGGLGNAQTQEQLDAEIKRLIPLAAQNIKDLATRSPKTLMTHYRLCTSLYKLFSTVPDQIDVKIKCRAISSMLYQQDLYHYKELLDEILTTLNHEMSVLTKASAVLSLEELQRYNINPESTAIDAMNQLAGVASLSVTDTTTPASQSLLLSHINVFTPDGLAAWFEHLQSLEGKPSVTPTKNGELYGIELKGRVSREAITARIEGFLKNIIIADEIHKEEYQFLYDTNHSCHQRINDVIQRYTKRSLTEVLPPRIGMTGTMNAVAKKAFGEHKIYELSTQDMIRERMTKQIGINTSTLEGVSGSKAYAKRVVIDYFANLPHRDLFSLSKGIIFSKQPNPEFVEEIKSLFTLLMNPEPSREQDALFTEINQSRGQLEPLSQASLRKAQTTAFTNHLFAIYLEYVLSKSTSPREFSDIVSLQNRMHARGYTLSNIADTPFAPDVMPLINNVGEDTLKNDDNIRQFLETRIHQSELLETMVKFIKRANKNPREMAERIQILKDNASSDWITDSQHEFESGGAMLLIGADKHRTGYSHEPVGIVIDAPADVENDVNVRTLLEGFIQRPEELTAENVEALYGSLQTLLFHTYAYDDKNQAGGRALRVTDGQVSYLEYTSKLSEMIDAYNHPILDVLKVDTKFKDIFTDDKLHAQAHKRLVNFNREAYKALSTYEEDFTQFHRRLVREFATEIKSQPEVYAELFERLPLLWSMKNNPARVIAFAQRGFTDLSVLKLERLSLEIVHVVPIEVPARVEPSAVPPASGQHVPASTPVESVEVPAAASGQHVPASTPVESVEVPAAASGQHVLPSTPAPSVEGPPVAQGQHAVASAPPSVQAPAPAPRVENNPHELLIAGLNAYIHRIESHKVENTQETNFKHGFRFFKGSQANNREKNYQLAKDLRDILVSQQESLFAISIGCFGGVSVDNRTVRSDELKRILTNYSSNN